MNCQTFDIDAFRKSFPEFSDTNVWADDRLELLYIEATCYVYPCEWHGLNGKCQRLALMLMVAHLCALSAAAVSGGAGKCGGSQGGIVTSATINKVSVSVLAPPASNSWEFWLAQSPYGVRLWALLRIRARGGAYVGGSPERSGFRKAGGVFW